MGNNGFAHCAKIKQKCLEFAHFFLHELGIEDCINWRKLLRCSILKILKNSQDRVVSGNNGV